MSDSTESFLQNELFGGAVSMALPARLMDVSDFRPVPDNQEIYADAKSDQSVVVEVMEHSRLATESPTAAEFYFKDLAEANEAQDSSIEQAARLKASDLPSLPPELAKSYAVGRQVISKGRQSSEAANLVQLIVVVIQMPQVGSDLLVTLNTPQYINAKSAAAEHAGAGQKTLSMDAAKLMKAMLQTLVIKDWGLFNAG